MKFHNVLLANPESVPEDGNDYRWKYFKGSAADSRILRDAVTRPNGLRVPNGCYYLCDGGYTNCNGVLAPY
ncbi:hypothetical protein ACS0TY_029371 [Phlomoides rotata]